MYVAIVTLKNCYDALLVPHYLLGFVALISFWVPAFAEKGKRIHRLAGRVFAVSMLLVASTALVLAGLTLWNPGVVHPDRSPEAATTSAWFLSYLAIVTFAIIHNGWGLTRIKANVPELRRPWRLLVNGVALAASLGALTLGLLTDRVVLIAMSPVGVLTAWGYYKTLRAPCVPT